MISVGLAAVPSILLLRILYGGRGAYDSDATHAFNLREECACAKRPGLCL